jgi:hypothetical protein
MMLPRWALWLLGLGCVGTLAYLAIVPPGRPRRLRNPRPQPRPQRRRGNPWRTLTNKRRVFIDEVSGRITKGLRRDWQGAHVRDVPELARRWRAIERDEADCAGGAARARATFASQNEGARALLEVNPDLLEFIEIEAKGQKENAYLDWKRRRRRGAKPELAKGDGRFDSFNQTLELKGRQRVSTWREALDRTVPPSRRWADFGPRLELLEDATGLRLNPPGPAGELEDQGEHRARCYAAGDDYRDALVDQARGGRLAAGEDVPF